MKVRKPKQSLPAEPQGPADRIEQFLTRKRVYTVVAILLLSALLRVGYFLQLNDGPLVWQHRWDQADMNFFDAWARQIKNGDLLSRNVLHPLHAWHKQTAAVYFEHHPQEENLLTEQGKAKGMDATRMLWERWLGGGRLYQEPFYPYAIALTYKVFGDDPRWVFGWQMLLGVVGNLLIYLIARRYFGELTAVVAAGLAVLCSPLLYYEMVLVRETTICFMGLLLVYLTSIAFNRRTLLWWCVLGAAMGFSILVKSTFAVYIVGVLVALAIVCIRARKWRELALSGGVAIAAVLVMLVPLVARNIAVGVPPFGTTSAGGIVFIGSNTPDYPPSGGFYMNFNHAADIMSRTDGRLTGSMTATIATHPSMTSYVELLWNKMVLSWHWYEIPSNSCFYLYREYSSVLDWMPVTFFILAPLSLVGLALGARRIRDNWPLYLLVFTSLLVLLMVHVMSRYRKPLEAALIPFAALTLVSIFRWLTSGRTASAVLTALAVIILWLFTGRSLPPFHQLVRSADYYVTWQYFYMPKVQEARARNDAAGAVAVMEDFLRHQPSYIAAPPSDPRAADPGCLQLYGSAYVDYANMLKAVGKEPQAQAAMNKAQRLAVLLSAYQGG